MQKNTLKTTKQKTKKFCRAIKKKVVHDFKFAVILTFHTYQKKFAAASQNYRIQ